MNAPTPSFEEPRLAQAIERLPEAAIHELPFGAIRLDPAGRVTFFSEAEARLSGYGPRPAKGGHFFTEIAPCLEKAGLPKLIEQARASGQLDIEFEQVGDFDDANKDVRYRVQSASDGGVWLFGLRL
jgi:photoactive yellow protein